MKNANSDVVLRVLTSSCAAAEAAVDATAITNSIIAAAAKIGVTLTAGEVTVVIAGCASARRLGLSSSDSDGALRAGRSLQSSVNLDISTTVSNLDSQTADTVSESANEC